MPSAPDGRPSPLPNRITPWGAAFASPARGAWVGNRGVIHDGFRITKRATTRGWVCCVLSFKGRRRTLMTPGRWTELFFLDEATAFATGHRPCFECRRADALAFAEAWSAGQGLSARASAPAMDAILNGERAHVGRRRAWEQRAHLAALPEVDPADLTRGAMVATGVSTDIKEKVSPDAWLFDGSGFHHWTPEGYAEGDPDGPLHLLTPPSVMAAFRAGYVPHIHRNVGAE